LLCYFLESLHWGLALGVSLLVSRPVAFDASLELTRRSANAGSWAAAFQGAAYAGATPAGGFFAFMTSAAMTGMVPLMAAAGSAISMAGTWATLKLFGK
jgi:hypothetical protein